MRSQVIPAQITTVEDKIVGNLNFIQLALMTTPILWLTLIYALIPPTMKLVAYKLILTLVLSLISLGLSLRIKGKVVINWLGVLLKYSRRPKYYLYNKNHLVGREMVLPVAEKLTSTPAKAPAVKTKVTKAKPKLELKNLLTFDELLHQGKLNLSYKLNKKGGLDVAFEQVKH